jgi:3-hydroxybutyryl-CoA dehydrogenase
MLINEAHDAVDQGVCSAEAVDVAMKSGVAYPKGPFAWGEDIRLGYVALTLSNIKAAYGEERYRTSPLLLAKCYE